jgi:hypothetical protein
MAEEIIINVAMDGFKIHKYRRTLRSAGRKPGEEIQGRPDIRLAA